jgi:periplasmic protein TonB
MGYQALLFCPDEKTARTVTQVLGDLDFSVERSSEPFAAVKKLMVQHFDAVVVDCDNEQNATLLFKSAHNSSANQSSLAVAVVEGQAGVAKAFRIGANLVLTKPINVEQAKGTLRVARGLLRKGAEAGKPATASAPPATAPLQQMPSATGSMGASGLPQVPPGAVWLKPSASPLPSPGLPQSTPTIPSVAALATSMKSQAQQYPATPEPDEEEVLEVPASTLPKPVIPRTSVPTAAPAKFPWQTGRKQMDLSMAPASRRSAPPTGEADDSEITLTTTEARGPAAGRVSFGQSAAGAVAPAKLRHLPEAAAPQILRPSPDEPGPGELLVKKPIVEDKLAFSPLSGHEPTPSTFFPGGYDADEVGSRNKTLIILAAVVLLASSAGYLGWRNMHAQSAAQAAAPTRSMAASGTGDTAGESKPSPVVREPASNITTSSAGVETPNWAPKAPAAAKSTPREQSSPGEPTAETAEPEVIQRLIVRNKTRQPAPPAPARDQEPVPAPSAIGVGDAADPGAIAGLTRPSMTVPKPSAQVVKVSEGVMEGLVLKRVPPRYPTQALQMRIQGRVELQATISKAGDITNLKAISGDGLLARAALEAVKQWKYKPYYLNGEPVEIQSQILVNFKLPN